MKIKSKKITFILIIFLTLITKKIIYPTQIENNVNPLSKIKISSETASCEKVVNNENILIITYTKNVLVTLADNSQIKAESLEIELNQPPVNSHLIQTTTKTTTTTDPMSNFRKITLSGNVQLNQKNRFAHADKIEFFAKDKKCFLSGNIKIEQKKEKMGDIPIVIESDKASIDLNNWEINLLGTTQRPVSTTIIVEGLSNLLPPPKNKKKKNLKIQNKLQAKANTPSKKEINN